MEDGFAFARTALLRAGPRREGDDLDAHPTAALDHPKDGRLGLTERRSLRACSVSATGLPSPRGLVNLHVPGPRIRIVVVHQLGPDFLHHPVGGLVLDA